MTTNDWKSSVGGSLAPIWEKSRDVIGEYAPTVLVGVGIAFGGWIAAIVARRVTDRLLRAVKINDAVEKTRVGAIIKSLGKDMTASRLIAQVAYFTLLLLTVNTLAGHFELSGLKDAISGVLAYLPKAGGGLTILAVGAYLGSVAKKSVGAVLRELRNPAAGLLETATEVGIILVSTLVALDVLGADLSFVTSNLTMLLGAALVIVVFLGCWSMRFPAEELVANYYLRRMLSVGDHVQTASLQGTVLEFQPLGIILRDAKGDEHFVPAKNLISGMQRRQGLTPD